jgi:hypothetical protein
MVATISEITEEVCCGASEVHLGETQRALIVFFISVDIDI